MLLDRSGQGKVYGLIGRRRFQQMDVLEGLNLLITISGVGRGAGEGSALGCRAACSLGGGPGGGAAVAQPLGGRGGGRGRTAQRWMLDLG